MSVKMSTEVFLMLIAAMPSLSCASTFAEGPQSLDLSDYIVVGDANWKSDVNGVSANKGNGFLFTKDSYEDFHLKVEFLAGKETNSGIFFRCTDENKITDQTCYEANIFDLRPDQKYRTGAITNYAPPKANINVEDTNWHIYEIFAVDEKIQVLLDGKETVFLRDRTHASGQIALQLAKGEIKFRNLQLRPLSSLPSNRKTILDGNWELESMNFIDKSGKVTPWCGGSYGVIIYTEGFMSTAINCMSDASKVLLYSGPFRIEGQTVFHQAQNYSNASLNKIHSRRFSLRDQNHLELSGELGDSTVVVKWVRR